jgi:hypothetical protein
MPSHQHPHGLAALVAENEGLQSELTACRALVAQADQGRADCSTSLWTRPCSRFGRTGARGNFVGRQPGRRFQAAAEVEVRDKGSCLEDAFLTPPGRAQGLDVGIIDHGGRLCQLLSVLEQGSSLVVEVIRPPRGGELRAQVLVPGEATHGRRVKPESGRPVHMPVDDDGEHLSLEAGQRRRLAEV